MKEAKGAKYADINIKFYKGTPYVEHLHEVLPLILKCYSYSMDNPPKMNKTFFRARQFKD